MTQTLRDQGAYAWFICWMLVVTVIEMFAFVFVLHPLFDMVKVSLGVTVPEEFDTGSDLTVGDLEVIMFVVAYVLVWWRVVKVVVLQGSPFPIGVVVSPGRQDSGGKGGRRTFAVSIGDIDTERKNPPYEGVFLYGAVFRLHPSSDKLARSRLEFLAFCLPFQRSFLIQESRFFILRQSHEDRAKAYREVADQYYVHS